MKRLDLEAETQALITKQIISALYAHKQGLPACSKCSGYVTDEKQDTIFTARTPPHCPGSKREPSHQVIATEPCRADYTGS